MSIHINLAQFDPVELGFPEKFNEFREIQCEAVEWVNQVFNRGKRFAGVSLPTGAGKTLFAMALAKMLGARTAILTGTKGLQEQYCLTPETRLLTSDLRWVQIGDLSEGDGLVGFDENRTPNRRMFRSATVEHLEMIRRPCYRLFLEDGAEFTCSREHSWLTRETGGGAKWMRTDALRVDGSKFSSSILRIVPTWNEKFDWGAGYLAAAFDGEGHLHQALATVAGGMDVNLSMAQLENPMYWKVLELLTQFDIPHYVNGAKTDQCKRITISGRKETLKFLGQIRPGRLLPKLKIDLLGMIGPVIPVRVIRREEAGQQWVIALKSSTGTYIAEGFASHNCNDFKTSGLFDIRGKDNYKCAGKPNLNLRCKYGGYEGCLLAGGLGCTYESERYHAKNSQVVISNYAYWVRGHKFGPGLLSHIDTKGGAGYNANEPRVLNPFELLICDEGHHAMEHLAGALRVTITERQLHAVGVQGVELKGSDQWAIADWEKWAGRLKPVVTKAMGDVAVEIKRNPSPGKLVLLREKIRDLDGLNESVDSIQSMQEGDWIVEERSGTTVGRVWDFDCVWPGKWSERLWVGVPKVVVMSATLHPMSLNLLGVSNGEREFKEWGRVFPAKNTPVVHVKTVKLNRNSTEEDQLKWVERVDEIVESRGVKLGRKGLVHTVSYARQQLYLKHSEVVQREGGLFHANNSSDPESGRAQDVYERFLGEKVGVLVSPSFGTGWDFPGDQCRWQVIVKVPFPDSRGKVMQARMERDERYLNYITMQELVQACGRGTRNEKDWCEVFIVDDSITYFLMRNGGLAPDWFKVRAVGDKLPPPIFTGDGK